MYIIIVMYGKDSCKSDNFAAYGPFDTEFEAQSFASGNEISEDWPIVYLSKSPL